jgi:cytochrome b involved in lipid metabolism
MTTSNTPGSATLAIELHGRKVTLEYVFSSHYEAIAFHDDLLAQAYRGNFSPPEMEVKKRPNDDDRPMRVGGGIS